MKVFAKFLAGLCLSAALGFGFTGSATSAPADRGGDPVVLKGSQVAGLNGVSPGRIVGFAYKNGKWRQIPVQIDERHTIDVRKLYPPGNHPPYVGNDDPDFDLEIYADPKTRSGADPETTFDENDELVFMGGDSGQRAPKGIGAPVGVVPGSGNLVTVKDPVNGGSAFVYLFTASWQMDQSAGKDYVKYDFKLTNLTEGQNMKDNYGYFTSSNPEDSKVATSKYQLHSFDRWQEDEMRITAGNADGSDILDREVAQATLFTCARSEFTFSGRWTEDTWAGNDSATDDEGTYIAVIDGAIRAIRSYMGANSGPYVQREHIYYRDFEQNTIFLRVHQMTDLYAWTDYAPAAIGMTYRDQNNKLGVPVDGNPDSLVPVTTEEVSGGSHAWQQISGPQGTVSTVSSAETDIPDPNFGTYYLDDETPDGLLETQCGGDGKSIGASGFGILGPSIPNTDPRSDHNDLTVKRSRYFGPPSEGVAQAEDYNARVSRPLAGVASRAAMKQPVPRADVRVLTRKVAVRRGKPLRLKVRVANRGNVAIESLKVCLRSKAVAGRPCVKSGKIGFGKAKTFTVRVKVKPKKLGKKLRLSFSYQGNASGFGVVGAGGLPPVLIRR